MYIIQNTWLVRLRYAPKISEGRNIHGMDLLDLRRSKVSGKPAPARSKKIVDSHDFLVCIKKEPLASREVGRVPSLGA